MATTEVTKPDEKTAKPADQSAKPADKVVQKSQSDGSVAAAQGVWSSTVDDIKKIFGLPASSNPADNATLPKADFDINNISFGPADLKAARYWSLLDDAKPSTPNSSSDYLTISNLFPSTESKLAPSKSNDFSVDNAFQSFFSAAPELASAKTNPGDRQTKPGETNEEVKDGNTTIKDGVIKHNSDAGRAVITDTKITETDRSGTTFEKDKTTGLITETGAKGTKFERLPSGEMRLTDSSSGDVWTYKDRVLTRTAHGITEQITDQAVITRFENSAMQVIQYTKANPPESQQSRTGINVMQDVIRINTTDHNQLLIHKDGKREIITANGDKFLLTEGSNSMVMVTRDNRWIKIDANTNRKFAASLNGLITFNENGTISVSNQMIDASGNITTSDNVEVDNRRPCARIRNATSQGDAVVSLDNAGNSVLTRPDKITSSVNPATGVATDTDAQGNKSVFDTRTGNFKVHTTDGDVQFNPQGATLWNGDRVSANGDVMRANGTFIGSDNTVRFADGTTVDSTGHVYDNGRYVGSAGYASDSGQVQQAQTLISAAQALSKDITARAQNGEKVDVGQLIAMYSQLGCLAQALVAEGKLSDATTCLYAQSDVSSGISQGEMANKIREITTSLTGAVPDSMIATISRMCDMVSTASVVSALNHEHPDQQQMPNQTPQPMAA
jgi:hypothetical protein